MDQKCNKPFLFWFCAAWLWPQETAAAQIIGRNRRRSRVKRALTHTAYAANNLDPVFAAENEVGVKNMLRAYCAACARMLRLLWSAVCVCVCWYVKPIISLSLLAFDTPLCNGCVSTCVCVCVSQHKVVTIRAKIHLTRTPRHAKI